MVSCGEHIYQLVIGVMSSIPLHSKAILTPNENKPMLLTKHLQK